MVKFIRKTSNTFQKYYSKFETRRNIWRIKHHNFSDPSSIHVTCSGISVLGNRDGGGAQLLRQLSLIAFSNTFGFSYVHTPLTSVAHNNYNDEEWSNKWENFLQLSKFSDVKIDKNIEFNCFKESIDLIPSLIKNNREGTNQFYKVRDCHSYLNRNISLYEGIRTELRQNYDNTERIPNLLFDENILNVAIHVRRGDIRKGDYTGRFTSAQKLKKVIQQIENVFGFNDYKIFIFCEEKQSDLEKLESENIQNIYHLDIFDVLDHLIHADLLVTSKSTISYIPALASSGIVIYEPYWHQPLPEWLNMDELFENELIKKLEHSTKIDN